MQKHPNEFTRRQILRYFKDRHLDVKINTFEEGYVIFIQRFSAMEDCIVDEPAGRLAYDSDGDAWRLYWMSGTFCWHMHSRHQKLHQALDEMFTEKSCDLFQKVL